MPLPEPAAIHNAEAPFTICPSNLIVHRLSKSILSFASNISTTFSRPYLQPAANGVKICPSSSINSYISKR